MDAAFERLVWENNGQTIASFYFRSFGALDFLPGQYVSVRVPHQPADNRGQSRTMTITSLPGEPLIRITTRVQQTGGSSYKRALLKLQPGDRVQLANPMGDFILPLDATRPLLFVAGGIGIASYASIFAWLVRKKEQRPITLLYAVRGQDDIVLQEDITRYAALYPMKHMVFSAAAVAANADAGDHTKRRMTAADIVAQLQPHGLVYLSGTEQMVEQLRRELTQQHHVPHEHIVFDYFDGYSSADI